MQPTILYDEDCNLCRSLAAWAERLAGDHIRLQSWQCLQASEQGRQSLAGWSIKSADKLHVIVSDQVYAGEEAWAWLLQHHPALRQIRWLAERLGLTETTAKVIHKSTHRLRRICPWCPRW